jgi:hypothetical protein
MTATVVADQAQLTPSAESVSFGNDVVGNAVTQNITLTNTGNTGISISTVAATGSGFSVAGVFPGLRLGPNQEMNLTVTFNPAATGAATGTLAVTSDATPLQIALSGAGVNTPAQHTVTLSWIPSASAVTGYFVYRGDGLNGPLSKLSNGVIQTASYVDTTVASGQSYNYAITAVGDGNEESTFSNQVALTIPSP